MAAATNAQVQTFVNERVRPHAEQIRALFLAIQDDKAVIDDIYNALNVQSPTWSDSRTDGPAHLLAASDVLGYNALITDLITLISGHGQYPVILKACVRP